MKKSPGPKSRGVYFLKVSGADELLDQLPGLLLQVSSVMALPRWPTCPGIAEIIDGTTMIRHNLTIMQFNLDVAVAGLLGFTTHPLSGNLFHFRTFGETGIKHGLLILVQHIKVICRPTSRSKDEYKNDNHNTSFHLRPPLFIFCLALLLDFVCIFYIPFYFIVVL